MGSAAFKPPGIQNKIEEEIRHREIESREEFNINLGINGSKPFNLDRELLGAFSKLNPRRKDDYDFDPIVAVEKEPLKKPATQDGLVMIFCADDTKKRNIKCALQKLCRDSDAVRWPNFKMARDQNSLYFAVRESMCRKVVGYTSFFLFYGVLSEQKLSQYQVEQDINGTVNYFNEYHKGALKDVPKFFIFEVSEDRDLCRMEETGSGTIFVTSNGANHLESIAKITAGLF